MVQVVTIEDLQTMKAEILDEIRSLKKTTPENPQKWVKSKQAREILGCSPGTLQNLRVNGSIEFSKIGGTLYYSLDSIMKKLESNKQNTA